MERPSLITVQDHRTLREIRCQLICSDFEPKLAFSVPSRFLLICFVKSVLEHLFKLTLNYFLSPKDLPLVTLLEIFSKYLFESLEIFPRIGPKFFIWNKFSVLSIMLSY